MTGAGFDVAGRDVVGGDVTGDVLAALAAPSEVTVRRETVVFVDEPTDAAVVLVRLASRVTTIFAAAPAANAPEIMPAAIIALRRFMPITIRRDG